MKTAVSSSNMRLFLVVAMASQAYGWAGDGFYWGAGAAEADQYYGEDFGEADYAELKYGDLATNLAVFGGADMIQTFHDMDDAHALELCEISMDFLGAETKARFCDCNYIGVGTSVNVGHLCQTGDVCYNQVGDWCAADEDICTVGQSKGQAAAMQMDAFIEFRAEHEMEKMEAAQGEDGVLGAWGFDEINSAIDDAFAFIDGTAKGWVQDTSSAAEEVVNWFSGWGRRLRR